MTLRPELGGGEGMTFGELLAEARVRHGLSRRVLARKIDCAQSYVGMLERGEREPSLPVLHKLMTALPSFDPGIGERKSRVAYTQKDKVRLYVDRLSPSDIDLVLRFVRRLVDGEV